MTAEGGFFKFKFKVGTYPIPLTPILSMPLLGVSTVGFAPRDEGPAILLDSSLAVLILLDAPLRLEEKLRERELLDLELLMVCRSPSIMSERLLEVTLTDRPLSSFRLELDKMEETLLETGLIDSLERLVLRDPLLLFINFCHSD